MTLHCALKALPALLAFATAAAFEGNPLVSIWGERDTKTLTAGWAALELPDGRMAIGGHSLLIFDGDRWQSFKMGNTYAIRGLDIGMGGELWAGATNELGVFRQTREGGYLYESLKDKLPSSLREGFFVWHTFSTHTGAIFITNKGILIWNGVIFDFEPLDFANSATAFKIEEGIVVADRNSGTYLINATEKRIIINKEKINPASIRWGFGTLRKLNIITKDGALEIDTEDPTSIRYYSDRMDADKFSKIRYGTTTKAGVYLASQSDGVFKLSTDGTIQQISIGSNHAVRTIYGISSNSDGSLWLLLRETIARISFSAEIFDSNLGITGSPIAAISKFRDQIYASTDDGIFRLSEGRFHKSLNAPRYRAWAMRNIEDERLAIAADEGLWLFDGQRYNRARGPLGVFQIGYASPQKILSTAGLGISLTDSTNLVGRNLLENLPDIPTSITTNSTEHFWFGTYSKGAYFAENISGRFSYARLTMPDLQPIKDGPATVIRINGRTVLLNNNGIFLESASPQFFQKIGTSLGYVHEYSNPDKQGRVWLSLGADPERGLTNRLGRISLSGDSLVWEPLDLLLQDRAGTPFTIFADDLHVWIGTDYGLVKYLIPKSVEPRTPRRPLIWTASPRLHTASPAEDYFGYNSRIAIRYSSLEFSSREALRFQTKLVGIDSDWSAPTNEASMELAGLREGEYEFMVRSTIDGYPSEPASVRFTILPPWWRTRYAYLAYALGFSGAVAAGVRLRERSQRRRTQALEREVHERTEQLRRANEAKTDFITAMSHDVRTPMNGIMGSTIELSRSSLSEEQAELVRRIEACSSMLSTLVEDVLDFAAIESGQVSIGHTPFSPIELLQSVSTVIEAEAKGASMTLVTDVDGAVPAWLCGDAHRIRQILVNYGSNAVKYAGFGTVTVRVARDGNQFIFSVKDEGAGISGADQGKLFTRFARLNASPDKEGKGLGLAGCRAIAGLMNGTVGVRSQMGKGSEFWLRLPLEVSGKPIQVPQSRDTTRYEQRALLVEDIDYSAEASKAVLAALGFDVTIVACGSQAINKLQKERFDVLFLDINLPDLSGTEVATTIRSLTGDASRIRIVATTAHSTSTHRAACIQAGMDAFLSKPLTPDKIHQAMLRSSVVSEDSPSAESRISFAMLDFLSKGSAADLRRHADLLLKGIDQELEALRAALATRNRKTLQQTAHRLITHARLAGDPTLIELAAALEDCARTDPFKTLSSQAKKIDQSVVVLREKLEDHLRRAESA